MGTSVKNGRQEKNEILISKFFDSETSFFQTLRVRHLLKKSPEAQNILDELSKVASSVKSVSKEMENFSVHSRKLNSANLWEKIEKRIAEEEAAGASRASNVQSLRSPLFDTLSAYLKDNIDKVFSRAGWGLSGAFITASLLMMTTNTLNFPVRSVQGNSLNSPGASSTQSNTGNFAGGKPELFIKRDSILNAQNFNPVSSNAGASTNVTKRGVNTFLKNKRYKNPIDIDWVKSDGKIHLIQDASERSTIFWIKKTNLENFYDSQNHP